MKMQKELIDKWGIIIMLATLIFSLILFWGYSSQFTFSFLAALLASAMTWLAYIVIRMIILAIWE